MPCCDFEMSGVAIERLSMTASRVCFIATAGQRVLNGHKVAQNELTSPFPIVCISSNGMHACTGWRRAETSPAESPSLHPGGCYGHCIDLHTRAVLPSPCSTFTPSRSCVGSGSTILVFCTVHPLSALIDGRLLWRVWSSSFEKQQPVLLLMLVVVPCVWPTRQALGSSTVVVDCSWHTVDRHTHAKLRPRLGLVATTHAHAMRSQPELVTAGMTMTLLSQPSN